ncbi:MAG TPA: response regulator transcription factor [Actinomycetota bacterium]
MTVSLLIVDDHEVVRVGLATLLGRRDDLRLAGVAASGAEGVALASKTRPDVVVMDVRMPGESGIEACREIRSCLPGTRVLMLTSYADEDAVLASILAGASGYLLKDTTGQDLAEAILRVAAGASLLDPAVTGLVLSRLKADSGLAEGALTDRERQILELIALGKTNREIGEVLYLAEGTVRNLVSGILAKLGVGTRAEAAARFARHVPDGGSARPRNS